MIKIIVPLQIQVGKKKISLSLNIFRNLHYHLLNQAKINFKNEVKSQLIQLPLISKCKLTYTFFFKDKRDRDISNYGSVISKFFEDTLVELNILEDDNYNFIPEVTFRFGDIDKLKPRCEIIIEEICK
jgi:hypothetical protein